MSVCKSIYSNLTNGIKVNYNQYNIFLARSFDTYSRVLLDPLPDHVGVGPTDEHGTSDHEGPEVPVRGSSY